MTGLGRIILFLRPACATMLQGATARDGVAPDTIIRDAFGCNLKSERLCGPAAARMAPPKRHRADDTCAERTWIQRSGRAELRHYRKSHGICHAPPRGTSTHKHAGGTPCVVEPAPGAAPSCKLIPDSPDATRGEMTGLTKAGPADLEGADVAIRRQIRKQADQPNSRHGGRPYSGARPRRRETDPPRPPSDRTAVLCCEGVLQCSVIHSISCINGDLGYRPKARKRPDGSSRAFESERANAAGRRVIEAAARAVLSPACRARPCRADAEC